MGRQWRCHINTHQAEWVLMTLVMRHGEWEEKGEGERLTGGEM